MRRFRIGLLSLFSLALLLAAPHADAGERRGRAQGRPASGELKRTVTRTGADGAARTSSHDTQWQRGDGRWTRDTVHTGPNGKQATTHVEGAKTEGGYTRNATHTGANGGVTTHGATGRYDADTRTWTKDVDVTRPDGSTVSKQVTRQVTPVTESAPSQP